MPNYILHLGFNWYGATLGYVWDSSNPPPYYSLQNAIAADEGAAMFTNFYTNDTLSIVIWDLSSSNDWSSGTHALTLALAFSQLDAATTIDPGTLFKGVTSKTKTVNKTTQYYLPLLPGFKVRSTNRSPWGSAQGNSDTLELLTFDVTSTIQCKLSFLLTVTTTITKTFVSDPEIIVRPLS